MATITENELVWVDETCKLLLLQCADILQSKYAFGESREMAMANVANVLAQTNKRLKLARQLCSMFHIPHDRTTGKQYASGN